VDNGVLAGFAGISVVQAENADVTYKAELSSLNSKTTGSGARGDATFTISGDQLTIHINAKGVSPNMEHLQHLTDLPKAIGSLDALRLATTRMTMGSSI
jgi:hypothetical protein